MNQTYNGIYSQNAVQPSLPSWGDLEGWVAYTYCANNPVIMIDEKGEFPIKIHELLVSNAIKGTKFEQNSAEMIFGTGIRADVIGINNSSIHLDGLHTYSQVATGYNNAITRFYTATKNNWFENAGEALHSVADFYAHSNYVELYEEYAKKTGIELDVDNIPTLNEGMKIPEFNKLLKTRLRTGDYGGTGSIIKDFINDKSSNSEFSHNRMNKDTPDSESGKQPFGKSTRYEAAFNVAKKAINQLINGKDE